ncbi:MAG: hypothetical protein ABIQ66_00190 [Novosphingobium sp.]
MANPYAAALEPYMLKFTADALLSEAERATNLFDWGGKRWEEERFRANVTTLCESLEATAQLTPLGRSRIHARVFTMLVSRLRYLEARKAARGVEEQALTRPLIGTGLGRAGTTFLHGILAADPASKVVRAYEAAMPAPLMADGRDIRSELYQDILLYEG